MVIPRSILAFITSMTITWYFEPWFVPCGLLLIFLKHHLRESVLGRPVDRTAPAETDYEEELGEEHEDKDEKKQSLKERLQAIQDITAMVQDALGYAAGLAESVKNTFNFTVPYLSWMAVIILSVVTAFLYFIPCRLIVMCWCVNKFGRKLIAPDTVTNNELADFLSRVPNDEMIQDAKTLKLQADDTPNKKGTSKKKGQK